MIRSTSRCARGFTLVELLVVITIIGTLIALLLPAVQAAREASRRNTCSVNEHNVALAMINFETSRHHFPGYVEPFQFSGTGGNTKGSTLPVSWLVTILPNLEHQDVYDVIKSCSASGSNVSPPPGINPFSSISFLICPNESPSPDTSSLPMNTWLSYVCNRGINGGSIPTGTSGINADSKATGVCLNMMTGMVAPAVPVSQDYISSKDGTSNTLLIAESVLENPLIATQPHLKWPRNPPASTRNSPKWISGSFSTAQNDLEVDVGFEWGTFNVPTDPKITDKALSLHSGGLNVAFCDGHTIFLSTTVDIVTFIHLMTPYDRGCPQNLAGSGTIKYCNVDESLLPGNSPKIPLQDVLDESKYK